LTVIKLGTTRKENINKADVWPCEGCGCIHIRAGELLLTFSAAEFAAFTETVNDCYWQQALRGDWAEARSSNSILQVPTAR
jgi:hypothetical protein